MTPSLCRLAHVALVTPDIERSLWFFRDLLGMEEVENDGTRSYLRCWGELDHHSLSLREGPVGVEHIAFRVGGPDEVARFAAALRGGGVAVEEAPRGDEAGQGDAIRFTMPHTEASLELVWELDRPLADERLRGKLPSTSTRMWRQGVSPRGLDHVAVQTSVENVAAADAWACETLGFERREWVQPTGGPMVVTFLAVTSTVHDIAISGDPQGRTGRFHHVALELEDPAALLRAADMMREHDIPVDLPPGRHGIARSMFHYVRDPGSGHRVEFYTGGYHVYDPDWEPIHWDESNLEYGLVFVGSRLPLNEGGPMDDTTPCSFAQAVS